jgi:hypothetical protein
MEGEMALNTKELVGGPGRDRTDDLMTASSATAVTVKEDKALTSAESGKPRQNPQPRRNPQSLPSTDEGEDNDGEA